MRGVLEIILIIYGLIIGMMSAFSISYERKITKDEVNQINQALSMMGKQNPDEKKQTMGKFAKISYFYYLVYSVLAVFLFLNQLIGLGLAALLIVIETIDYMLDRNRIKKAETFNKLITPTKRSFMVHVAHIIVVGIHIGLIL